ncbi:MAG: hypothetical protein Q8M94_13385 [Ignavibacteria bacterium]|nr:hypothetical protein [Ignavibacteria bacterium]
MTACEKMFLLLDKLLEQKKSLDEIGEYICDGVEHPRLKAIRLIKTRKGEQYLKDNAEWLGFEFHKPNINFNKNVEVHSEPQPQPQPIDEDYKPTVCTEEFPDPDHCACIPIPLLPEHQKRCTFCRRGIYDIIMNKWEIDYE